MARLLAAVLLMLPSAGAAVRIPDELQPLSADTYTFEEQIFIVQSEPTSIAIHSGGGTIDLRIRQIRTGGEGTDTLRVWESTQITPREEIDERFFSGDEVARYDNIAILPGTHRIGLELSPGSSAGIYEVRLRTGLDGTLVNLQAGIEETSRTAFTIGDVTYHSPKVDWFGRTTIPELVGRKDFEGSFASADRLASSRGGWGLVLPRDLTADLPRFRDSRGYAVDLVTTPDQLTEEELRLGAIWLAGDPAHNRWVREALERIGTTILPSGYRLADGRTTAAGVLDCVIANPWAPELPMRLTVAPSLEDIETSGPVDHYRATDPAMVLDISIHHTVVTGKGSLLFLDGKVSLTGADDGLLFQVGASDETGAVYARAHRDPGIWTARFEMTSENAALSLGNLSQRWDLRLEHFFIVWDGGVVNAIGPGAAPFQFGETSVPSRTPPWNTEYEVIVQTVLPDAELDLSQIKVNAVPFAQVDGNWVARKDTVWGVPMAGAPDRRLLRFTRNGEITRWTLNLINATGRDTVYIFDDWNQERSRTLRYIPFLVAQATRYTGQNKFAVSGLTLLFASIVVIALVFRRKERQKTVILDEIKNELNRAREIQQSLFPSSSLRTDQVEIAGVCRSMQEVGGDYYDYFVLPDGTVLFTIADVAGHGYGAALRMSGIHYHLHRGDFSCKEPGKILTDINHNLASSGQPSEFVTGFLACLTPDKKRLHWANAGHPGAILVRSSGKVMTLTSTGLPLGVLPEATYEEKSIAVEGDDLVVAFTDGLLEATNHVDEEFGERRVQDVLVDCATAELGSIFDSLFRSVAGFSGTQVQEDDMAIIAARIVNSSGNGSNGNGSGN